MAITLKDLQVGNIDAKNELLTNSELERRQFVQSFITPPNIVPSQFITGQRYFVTGLKGTGKTALLHFLALELEEKHQASTSFVLFKAQVDEDQRKCFARASRTELIENNSADYEAAGDFESVWKWFLHAHIVNVLTNRELGVFRDTPAFRRYVALAKAPVQSKEPGFWRKLVPTVKKGNVTISKSPAFKFDVVWGDTDTAQVKFSELASELDAQFSQLEPGSGRLCIFLDEIELSLHNKKQHQRDAALIRDLIVTIEKINAVAKSGRLPISVYAGIRTEVLSVVGALGKEINKPIADFGTRIVWHRSGCDISSQPLLGIIGARLAAAEARHKACQNVEDSQTVWNRYFPPTINNERTASHILHNSWYRPRDIVRLLAIARDQYPDSSRFGHEVFDGVRKLYSSESWTELAEELTTKYSQDDIDAIKLLFYGFKSQFSFPELRTRATEIADLHKSVNKLLDKCDLAEIVVDLYRVGVLGNIERRAYEDRHRWAFRGDDEVLLQQHLQIHRALWRFFSI